MENDQLKILLSLEPSWTVSLNGLEFQTIRSSDIAWHNNDVRLGKWERRIDAVEWMRPNVVRLRGHLRFRTKTDILTLYPGDHLPPGVDSRRRRRAFQAELGPALREYFQTRTISREMLYSDRRYGIGGAYPRFIVGNQAVIAVEPDESSTTVNAIMRAAMLWSALIRKPVSVVVPAGRAHTIASRLQVLAQLREKWNWLQWDGNRIAPLATVDGPVQTEVHEFVSLGVDAEVARILASVPFPLQPVANIAGQSISIRFRGIDVAQVRQGSVTFPYGEPLEPFISELAAVRRHGSVNVLARAHEERWLESNLIGEIGRLLPSIDPQYVYPQVPSFVGEERNIIDLLSVTRDGRLVVMEIKASADPDLPLQALDYWIAVEHHRKAGDFQKKGYFRGIQLKDEPALLVLVAPLLAFHKTYKRMVSVFPKEVPLLQIGLNQAWKREIKILRRQQALG